MIMLMMIRRRRRRRRRKKEKILITQLKYVYDLCRTSTKLFIDPKGPSILIQSLVRSESFSDPCCLEPRIPKGLPKQWA